LGGVSAPALCRRSRADFRSHPASFGVTRALSPGVPGRRQGRSGTGIRAEPPFGIPPERPRSSLSSLPMSRRKRRRKPRSLTWRLLSSRRRRRFSACIWTAPF
jgi:hypothetical protein